MDLSLDGVAFKLIEYSHIKFKTSYNLTTPSSLHEKAGIFSSQSETCLLKT
jgi:hypothetical protein